ncbi:MAG: DNA polymerase III subunit alpha [Dehalococcoidia bacterium]|nr:DNA polymerase III subunit alpha [Dehalococcoidia bacterium]
MFSHLHVHTEYSMLDGLSRLDPLVARAKELEMDSLAITDHGGMYGAIDFYRKAKSEGIRPIVGCEMYVAPGSRHERNPNERSPYHMTVLAKNNVGYQNLAKLITMSHLEGFYYKPRVDREILERHHEGLIVMSGCPSGEVPTLITQGRMDEARATASWYRDVFGDYYLEFMRHGDVPDLPQINNGLLDIRRDLDIPAVATNDSHYVHKHEARLQDILICIHTNTNIQDEKRLLMAEDSYYLTSPAEMQELFQDLPEAVANTQKVAEMCDLDIDFSQLRLPQYTVPEGVTPFEYLSNLCWDGLKRRLPNAGEEEKKRLEYELEVIRQTSFDNYFLVVWDIARFVRERDIFFAVRGSAAASLTLYCLGVTNVNPLPYRLVFERFLNLERKEMPDIDMDFQDDRREEVINYVVQKYGREHVAHIITFGTLGARAALRDVGRALGMTYGDVDRVARMIPTKLGITLDEAKSDPSSELAEAINSDDSIRNLVETAEGLEGVTRHSSTHAAGVVISQQPLDEIVPLQRPQKADDSGSVATTTQYAMEPVAALGLLKLDFLGLVNLTVLAKARDLIAERHGISFDLVDIPLDDAKTFALLSRGDTAGVFQLEGGGMTRYIKELKPSALADVAAMIALYRPGPMEHISTFIDAKHGRVPVSYLHPALEEILEETYGVIVYQDQVLHIARTFAGYTLGEADIVRKAMGKKIPEIMAQEKEKFIKGALGQGFDQELADKVFALVEPFAGYAFNKAHSVSYGLISYWTAYLKANYTAEYMVSLLNSYVGHNDRINSAVAECQRLKIPVLPPSINNGRTEFTIESHPDGGDSIRFGMGAVKGVGASALDAVIDSRDKMGRFESIEHMCREANMSGVNRKTLESLIKVGALDDFGDRAALLEAVDRIVGLAQSEASLKNSDQSSMFDLFGESVTAPLADIALPDIAASDRERDEWERELLGMSLSNINILATLLTVSDSEHIVFRSDIQPDMAGKRVSLVGQIAGVTRRFTRQNKPFVIATLGLMDGQIEVFVWEDKLDTTEGLWQEGNIVVIGGTVRVREDEISINCNDAGEYTTVTDTSPDSSGAPYVPPVSNGSEAPTHAVKENGASYTDDRPDVPETVAAKAEANGSGAPPPVETNGTAAAHSETNGHAKPSTGLAHSQVQVPHRLNLRIRETDNAVDDQMMLDDVKRKLLDYEGKDDVMLEIASGGMIYRMEWSSIQVSVCDDLTDDLSGILEGSGTVTVEAVRA